MKKEKKRNNSSPFVFTYVAMNLFGSPNGPSLEMLHKIIEFVGEVSIIL